MKSYSELIVEGPSPHQRLRNTLRIFISLFYCNRNSVIDQRIAKLRKSLKHKRWNELSEVQRIHYMYEKAAVERAVRRMLRLKN